MLLYYVQRTMEKEIKEFFPRISEYRMENEDDKQPRITLSKSIKVTRRNKYEIFRLYTFDSSKIKPENFINSNKLFELGLVPDANLTEEVWIINQNLIANNIKYFAINDNLKTKKSILFTPTVLEDGSISYIDSGEKVETIEKDIFIYFYLKTNLKTCSKISCSKSLKKFTHVFIPTLMEFLPEEFYCELKKNELKTRISYKFPDKILMNYKLFERVLNEKLQIEMENKKGA